MRKKLLSIILALTMVLGMVPFAGITVFAEAQKIDTSDVTWELTDSNKTLIIGGTGAMPDFVPGTDTRAPWLASAQTAVTTVIIGSGVTTIGNMAFFSMKNISSITIPSSVKSIGVEAFTGCTSLKNLYIESIESWCNVTFRKNGSTENSYPFTAIRTGVGSLYVNGEEIKELKIPNTVTSIPKRAFYKCSITSVTIPSSVKTIYTEAFYSCSKLTSVIVKSTEPPTLQEYSAMPYSNSGFKIYVPAGKNDVYQNTSPWSLSYLKNKLTEAYMAEAALAEHGTVILDKDCFPTADYTTASETVTVTATPDEGYQLKSLVYNDGTSDTPITENQGAYSFTMPTANVTVKAIFEEAAPHEHTFADTWSSDANGHWHACTATGCDVKAEDISTHTTDGFKYSTHVDENKDFVCDDCGYEDRAGAEAAGFKYENEGDNTILTGYTGVGGEIVIPGWTTVIGNWAFFENNVITKVTIPASVEKIGEGLNVFSSSPNLESVIFEEGSKLKTIGDYAFGYCKSLAEINLEDCKELETIGMCAFEFTGFTSITIPASVNTIGTSAFQEDYEGEGILESVIFEEGSKLKTIGSCAFQFCRRLAEINLDACKELETIGDSAFSICESLTEIDLDACQKLVTIDSCAFCDTGLTSIHIPASVKEIGSEAFSTPGPLTDLYLNWTNGDDIVEFDFWGEDGTTTVHIPEGTRSIYIGTCFEWYLPSPVVTLVNATYHGRNTFTYFVGEYGEYILEPADIDGKKFKKFVLDSDYEGVEITDCTLSIGDEVNADITVTAVYDTLSADYGALNAAISAADEITDSTLYTAGSWVKFRTAKDYAKSIGSDLDIRYQSKVDEAEAALTLATENLVKLSKSQYNMINEFCEYDGLMARQGKIVDGVVSDKVGRTIIPLTQDQLDSIDEYIWVVGFDGYKEFKVKIDCAYTWFYNGGDKIEAGVTPGLENYAAFIIIYNDGTDNDDNTITGFGYYRIYNGEIPDDGEGIMLDTLYLDPKFAVIPKELRNTAWTAQIDVEGGNSYDAILTIGIDSATLSFDGNEYTLPAVSFADTELCFEDGTGSYLSIIDDGDAVGYIEGCVGDTIIVSVVESIEKA